MPLLPDDSRFNLHSYHTIFLELGLILALLIFISAMRAPLPASADEVRFDHEPERVTMKDITRTVQREKPAAPAEPVVTTRPPDDNPIAGDPIDEDFERNTPSETVPVEPPPRKRDETKENVFEAVEQMPELIGGIEALQQKVHYPKRCMRAGIEGRVTLQFVVNRKGDVEEVQVLSGIGGGCDEAAVKAVKEHARFTPGRQRGEAVKVRYSLPVFFRLR